MDLKIFAGERTRGVVFFVAALAYLDLCGLNNRAYNRGGRSKSVFLNYFNLNSKLEFLSSFPGRLMNYQVF